MVAKQINIDPTEKTINVFVDDITISEIKELVKHFVGMDDYEILIHNPKQSTCIFDTYEGNISIDKLCPDRNFFGSENYYNGGVIREHNKDPHLLLNNKIKNKLNNE